MGMGALFADGSEGACADFLHCRDRETNAETRAFLERAWDQYAHVVGDRERHFLSEFRSSFHSKAWELYLLAVLADAGCELHATRPEGPDICATIAGRLFWIEAVVPTPGAPESKDRVFQRPPGNWMGALYSEESLLLRYRSVLEDKLEKIDVYVGRGIVGRDEAVLIAVNQGGILDSDMHDVDVPAIVKAVFPIGPLSWVITPNSGEPTRTEFPLRYAIKKAKPGVEVSTTLFLEKRSAAVSGVLFARQLVWRLERSARADLGLVHNLRAAVALPRGILPVRCELWVENDELRRDGKWSRRA